MRKDIFGKGMVLGIIFLFVGAGVVPSISGNLTEPISRTIIIVDNEGDGDFTNIQEAIDNASEGDTIEVYSGKYIGKISIKKCLDIVGIDSELGLGNDSGKPIIDCNSEKIGISLEADGCSLSGFHIINFSSLIPVFEGAICISASDISILSNNISNEFGVGVGITITGEFGGDKVKNIIISENSFINLIGINTNFADNVEISKNNFFGGDPIMFGESQDNKVIDNIFVGCVGAVQFWQSDDNLISHNIFIASGMGVWLRSSNYNIIEYNDFLFNGLHIFLTRAHWNKFRHNYYYYHPGNWPKLIFGFPPSIEWNPSAEPNMDYP